MDSAPHPDRIEAPAPVTTPVRLPGSIPPGELVEFPERLDIGSIERSGPTRDDPELPPAITLYCGAHQLLMVRTAALEGWVGGVHHSAADGTEGWEIYPITPKLDVAWDQPVGRAVAPASADADPGEWLSCPDVFTAEAVEYLAAVVMHDELYPHGRYTPSGPEGAA